MNETAQTTVTVETLTAEFRDLLNSRWIEHLKSNSITGGDSITDPKFYAKVVREWLGERRITSKHRTDWYARHKMVAKAIDHAIYCCDAPARKANASLYNGNFRKCGLC